LYGKLQRFADEIYRAKEGAYGNLLKGVGIIPEGLNNNPVAYDLVLELAWHNDRIEVNEWIKKYVPYRYGADNTTVQKAWKLLLETVYSSPQIYQEGPSESIFCARPAINIKSVSTWGTRKRNYDRSRFEEAVRIFVSASGEMQQSETYNADKIDFVRQFMANRADTVYSIMMEAISRKDIDAFKKASGEFQYMILQQDSLLNTNKHFRLDTWLTQALNFGRTNIDKSIALKNAKIQITYWGPDYNPETSLHDYAHKEWGGLLSSLYLERWKLFFESEVKKMNNQHSDVNYFQIEKEWTEGLEMYDIKPLSQVRTDLLIRRILSYSFFPEKKDL
jgi:alpha-N-acetylglucosaminidase